jgi:hypothetical protein
MTGSFALTFLNWNSTVLTLMMPEAPAETLDQPRTEQGTVGVGTGDGLKSRLRPRAVLLRQTWGSSGQRASTQIQNRIYRL